MPTRHESFNACAKTLHSRTHISFVSSAGKLQRLQRTLPVPKSGSEGILQWMRVYAETFDVMPRTEEPSAPAGCPIYREPPNPARALMTVRWLQFQWRWCLRLSPVPRGRSNSLEQAHHEVRCSISALS